MSEPSADIESVLVEIGEFGRYQIVTFVLLSALNFLNGVSIVNFMISASTLDYRCKVPECEFDTNIRNNAYNRSWLNNAIPSKNDKFENCLRFAPRNVSRIGPGKCSADRFDTTTKIECSEFIHASDERNLQTEFNIHCADDYKLALVGTIGNVARFILLPLTGLISDRFGRLPGLVVGSQLAFMFAVAKSFSTSYLMYVVFEFLEAASLTSCFTGIYLYAIESLSKRYRVLGNTTMFVAFALGEICLGIVAMYVHDFRDVIRIFSIPGLLIFTYFWILSESVRWLLATGRIERAIDTLKRIAQINHRQLSDKSIELIRTQYSSNAKRSTEEEGEQENGVETPSVFQLLESVLKSRRLCLRFLSCCYQFAAVAMYYYGLSQLSTQIAGANRYVSFIIVMAIEIPANVVAQILLDRWKRKALLFTMYVLGAVSIIATAVIPKEHLWAILLCFVIGKGALSIAFTALYLFVAEQFPTPIRNTIMNTCSMIGRIGSMVAPFVVVLGLHFGSLPALVFGASSIFAAFAILLNPETFAKKLPDTIEEAEQM